MKRIITDTVKESKGRGRHPSSNMALLSLSRFRINRIMLSASTGLQFLILWFKLDQSISKFWRKAGQLKRKWSRVSVSLLQTKQSAPSVFKSQGIPPFRLSQNNILIWKWSRQTMSGYSAVMAQNFSGETFAKQDRAIWKFGWSLTKESQALSLILRFTISFQDV